MPSSPLVMQDAPETGAAGSTVAEAPAPLITGDVQYLWSGVIAVVVIFAIVFWLLGRWRAQGAADRRSYASKDFFQPAGESAEISFDDEAGAEFVAEPIFEPAEEAIEPKKKKSPFASLFSGRADRDRAEPNIDESRFADDDVSRDDYAGQDEAAYFSEPEIAPAERSQPQSVFAADEFEGSARAAPLHRLDEEESDRKWRAAEEERKRRLAEDDRRRAEREAPARFDDQEIARLSAHAEPSRASAHEELARTLSEVEEALHVQREAIQAETRSLLDSFARRFSERIDALANSFERRAVHRLHEAGAGEHGHDAAFLEMMNARLDAQGRDIADALAALAHRIDATAPASEIAALREEISRLRHAMRSPTSAPSAPALQLEDVVRDAIAPGGYEFNAALTNNYRADCLIKLARPPGPIAIDARFPVEAFSDLRSAGDSHAETEFRRIALRHVVSVAERLIAPGFTADCAMMFIPSESMAAELYARFPDIIQDSYRARVWIVSPTSLMATLHALSGVLRGAPVREKSTAALDDARRALAEIDRLEARLSALEVDSGRYRDEPAENRERRDQTPLRLASANERGEPAERRGLRNTMERSDLSPNGDLYGDDRDDETQAARQSARTPFPLR